MPKIRHPSITCKRPTHQNKVQKRKTKKKERSKNKLCVSDWLEKERQPIKIYILYIYIVQLDYLWTERRQRAKRKEEEQKIRYLGC